jgi:hypothetical protein
MAIPLFSFSTVPTLAPELCDESSCDILSDRSNSVNEILDAEEPLDLASEDSFDSSIADVDIPDLASLAQPPGRPPAGLAQAPAPPRQVTLCRSNIKTLRKSVVLRPPFVRPPESSVKTTFGGCVFL